MFLYVFTSFCLLLKPVILSDNEKFPFLFYFIKKGGAMKKFFLIILLGSLFIIGSKAFADEQQEAIKFFKKYVNAANNYSDEIAQMYSPDAKIIRQVVKPDGSLVDVETDADTYISQMKLSQKGAKLKNYKNNYSDITALKVDNGYKITALRQPSGENYKLKTYMIVQKQPSGKWLIVEEMMQTKVQTFLKYAKN